MSIFGYVSFGAVIEAQSEVVKDGENKDPAPRCNVCEIEIKHEEADFIIVVGDTP